MNTNPVSARATTASNSAVRRLLLPLLFTPCFSAAAFAVEWNALQEIPGTAGATRARIEAGANEFHVAYHVPTRVSPRGVIEAGSVQYVRYRAGKWSAPVEVHAPGENGALIQYADVAGDSKGNGYVTWVNLARNRWFFATVRDGSKVELESRTIRHGLRAEVVLDDQDRVIAAFRDKGPECNMLLVRPAGVTRWESEKEILSDSTDGQQRFSLAFGAGKLFYAYRHKGVSPGQGIRGAQSIDLRELRLDAQSTRIGFIGLMPHSKPWGPQLVVDAKGGVHSVWNQNWTNESPKGRASTLFYKAPDSPAVELGEGYGDEWPPTAAVNNDGEVIIVRSTIAEYRSAAAGGWVDVISGRGGKFSTPQSIATEQSGHSSWGSIAGRGSSIMVVWSNAGKLWSRTTK